MGPRVKLFYIRIQFNLFVQYISFKFFNIKQLKNIKIKKLKMIYSGEQIKKMILGFAKCSIGLTSKKLVNIIN